VRYYLLSLIFAATLFADERPPVAFPRAEGIAIPWSATQVLLLGGWTLFNTATGSIPTQSSIELYDYKTGKSVTIPAFPSGFTGRVDAGAVRLKDGRVLDCPSGCGLLSSDLTTWTPTANLPDTQQATFLALGDGTVLAAGGIFVDMSTNAAWLFDPQTNQWTETNALGQGRVGEALLPLADGRAVAVAGYTAFFCIVCFVPETQISSIEIYDPVKQTWTPSLAKGRSAAGAVGTEAAVVLSDGRVLFRLANFTEIYNPVLDQITDTKDKIPVFDRAVSIPTGEALIFPQLTPQLMVFNPTTGTLRSLLAPAPNLALSTLVAMPDGTVLLIGGADTSKATYAATTTVESVAWEPWFTTTLDPGFYIATATQNDGATDGLAGIEIDTPGAITDGLFFGGLLAAGGNEVGFGSFTVGVTQAIQFDLSMEGLPGSSGSLTVTAQIYDANHQPVGGAMSGLGGLHWNQSLPPGFYVLELRSGSSTPAAAFQMNISAAQFLGGGSYGATLQGSAGVTGYVAFNLPTRQSVTLKLSNENTFGRPRGSGETILTLMDANRRVLQRMGPGGMTGWSPTP